jgi:uncharacterized protein
MPPKAAASSVAAGSGKDEALKPFLLAALLALPCPAKSETREDRVAIASEYVELAMQGFDMATLIETMYQPILQQVAASGQTLTDAQVAAIRKLYVDTFSAPMTSLMREQAGLMADMMTMAEITALRDFYATPEGRSVMSKLPQLTAAQQPGIGKLINDNMTGLMPQVLAVINGDTVPTTQP